jgi:hypothetical protein
VAQALRSLPQQARPGLAEGLLRPTAVLLGLLLEAVQQGRVGLRREGLVELLCVHGGLR